jgi:hypothetical protein
MEKKFINNKEECLKVLAELGIGYKIYDHDAVFNME